MVKSCVVTGAFGYSGAYIAKRMLNQGTRVKTLTNSINRHSSLQGRIEVEPFHFGDPDALRRSLEGYDVLINTYWVRFNHWLFKHADAVDNTLELFAAAKAAGVKRIVHISITNPSADSDLEYFSGKALLEDALKASGVSYAILRPTVLFGPEDILVNNIAWVLRHFPVFPVFGDGSYRLQPIYVDDLARLAVECAAGDENTVINAIGPETFTYYDLIETIAKSLKRRCRILRCPPTLAWILGKIAGYWVHDVIVTREEIDGLMRGLLYVEDIPQGTTHLTEWLKQNPHVGSRYSSELSRRKNRLKGYETQSGECL